MLPTIYTQTELKILPFQDIDIIDNNWLFWFLNLLRPNEPSEIVRSFQPWAFEEIFHISMIYFHLSSIMAVLRSFQGLLSSTFASFVSSTFLATWQYLGKHLHLRKLREKILFFGKTWIDLSTKRWKFLSHLFPEASCRFDGWLDHHRLRLLVLRLHVAVVLRVAGPHHLQLGVARLVQTSHRRVVHLLTPGRVQPLTLQGVQRVGSPTISWRPVEASLWAGSRQRVLTFGVFVCNAIFFTSCRLLLLTEEGELFAEIRGAVFSKLVLDVVCVRLAPDPRAGKLKSAAIFKNATLENLLQLVTGKASLLFNLILCVTLDREKVLWPKNKTTHGCYDYLVIRKTFFFMFNCSQFYL